MDNIKAVMIVRRKDNRSLQLFLAVLHNTFVLDLHKLEIFMCVFACFALTMTNSWLSFSFFVYFLLFSQIDCCVSLSVSVQVVAWNNSSPR